MATINFLYRLTKTSFLHLCLLYRFYYTDFVYGVNTKLEVSKEYWGKFHKQTRQKDIEVANKQNVIKTELDKN